MKCKFKLKISKSSISWSRGYDNYPICHLFFGKQNNKNSITKFSCCPHLPLSSSASSADVLKLSSKFTTFIYEQSHQCISQPNQTNYLPLIPVNGDDGNYYGTKSVLLLARTHEEGRRRAKLLLLPNVFGSLMTSSSTHCQW